MWDQIGQLHAFLQRRRGLGERRLARLAHDLPGEDPPALVRRGPMVSSCVWQCRQTQHVVGSPAAAKATRERSARTVACSDCHAAGTAVVLTVLVFPRLDRPQPARRAGGGSITS